MVRHPLQSSINRLLTRLPGKVELTPDHVLALLMRWGGEVTLEQLRQEPGGVLLPPNEPGTFFGKRVASDDGKVQLYPKELASDLPRLQAEENQLRPRSGQLVLSFVATISSFQEPLNVVEVVDLSDAVSPEFHHRRTSCTSFGSTPTISATVAL